MYRRLSNPLLSNSFFLFGPRGSGKSSLLRERLPAGPKVFWFDFLDDVLFHELLARPSRFVELIPKDFGKGCWVVADEIQRLPGLLNYVHLLIEERKISFALTGSSARKLKRGGANLLAGRAFLNTLHPLTHRELGADFDLEQTLNWGGLPRVLASPSNIEKEEFLKSYVATYLTQEIKEEQVVRQLDPFARFLEVASQHNGQIINASKIGRESLSNPAAILRYFEILCDTFMGFYLEPYHRSIRKVQTAKSKFYFFDLGIRKAIERTLKAPLSPGTYAYGRAFEHFFLLECIRLNDYARADDRFYYMRTKDDVEIDLLIERPNRELWAIEVKSSERVDASDFNRAVALAKDLKVKRFIVASREQKRRTLKDIEIWPWRDVLEVLYPSHETASKR